MGPRRRRTDVSRGAAHILLRRMRLPALLLAFALVYGTTGYLLIEHFSLLDALYMTVTTLVTVGYGEIHPLSPGGRAFTLTLITIGVGAVFILIGAFTSALASGELGLSLKRRTMRSRLPRESPSPLPCRRRSTRSRRGSGRQRRTRRRAASSMNSPTLT